MTEPPADQDIDFSRGERFTRLLLEVQPRLFGFVLSLTHDQSSAKDVTQEVGVLLWRKFDEFEPGTDFGAWALKVARYKVMEWRRSQSKLPLVLDDEALELLANESEEVGTDQSERLAALDGCLKRLPPKQQQVIHERYLQKDTVVDIAARWKRSRVAIHQLLKKAHTSLRFCVNEHLRKATGHPES